MCWNRGFIGQVWLSDHDDTSAVVICKPEDEVAGLGRITFSLWRAWKLLKSLPIPE